MTERRFIFLDIDGVLNHEAWYDYIYEMINNGDTANPLLKNRDIDPECVTRLNQLEGCEIVISSSWGYDESTINSLRSSGLKLPIIGGIDHLELGSSYHCRGNSIAKWFYDNFNKSVPWDYLFRDDGWYYLNAKYEGRLDDLKLMNPDEVTKVTYVIIDDDADMLMTQSLHFIKVDPYSGLTDESISKAKEILKL